MAVLGQAPLPMEQVIAGHIDPARYREITGMPLSGSRTLAKIAWIGRHNPELLAQARYIANGQE